MQAAYRNTIMVGVLIAAAGAKAGPPPAQSPQVMMNIAVDLPSDSKTCLNPNGTPAEQASRTGTEGIGEIFGRLGTRMKASGHADKPLGQEEDPEDHTMIPASTGGEGGEQILVLPTPDGARLHRNPDVVRKDFEKYDGATRVIALAETIFHARFVQTVKPHCVVTVLIQIPLPLLSGSVERQDGFTPIPASDLNCKIGDSADTCPCLKIPMAPPNWYQSNNKTSAETEMEYETKFTEASEAIALSERLFVSANQH